jgi:galactonate dehydratase
MSATAIDRMRNTIDHPSHMTHITTLTPYSARISDKTVWTFVCVHDSAGREGWGEATLPGEHAVVHTHVAALAPTLHGLTPDAGLTQLAALLPSADTPRAAALSALDQALWDLIAQARGLPLAQALGLPQRATVKLYANINRGTLDRSPEGFAARAREAALRGFTAIKIAPFDDVRPESAHTPEGQRLIARGVKRVLAVRAAIGDERALMVDCHWRFTEATASAALHELAPAHLYWFECPLPETHEHFDALRRLKAKANAMGVKTAGCEMLTGVAAFGEYLDGGIYDAIMPDVKYAGGLREMLRIDA